LPTPTRTQIPNLQTILNAGLGKSKASKVVASPTGPLVTSTEKAKVTLNFKLPQGTPQNFSNKLEPLETGGLPYALRFGPGTQALETKSGLTLKRNAKLKVPKQKAQEITLPSEYKLYVVTNGSVAIGERAWQEKASKRGSCGRLPFRAAVEPRLV
jgi:hypothetical protein